MAMVVGLATEALSSARHQALSQPQEGGDVGSQFPQDSYEGF